jgi:sulfate transport system ATP-binding protein
MEVASQVVVLNHGRIEQQGAPGDIYDHPANAFVSRFIGQTNVFYLEEQDVDWLQTAGLSNAHRQGKVAHVRPHDIIIEKSLADSDDGFVTLKDWQHLGSLIRIELVKNGSNGGTASVYAEMPNDQFRRLHLSRGDKVDLRIRHAHWFH